MPQVQRHDFLFLPENDEEAEMIGMPMYRRFKRTAEGFLQGRAVVTNIGIFPYQQADGSIRLELRPPEEVFSKDSLDSLRMKPLTDDHPTEAVTADNIAEYQVGTVGEEIYNDAYRISAPITVHKADAVAAVEGGKRALSCGYMADLDMTPGVWMGLPYDAVQRNIRYNHLAIVDRGRAGDAAVMKLDAADIHITLTKQKEGEPMPANLKKITLDGVEYEAEAPVLTSLSQTQAKLDAALAEQTALKDQLAQATAKADAAAEELALVKKQAEDAAAAFPAKLQEAIAARALLLDSAVLAGLQLKGDESDDEIRKQVILAAHPSAKEKLDSADAAYISARFDAAVEVLHDRDSADGANLQRLRQPHDDTSHQDSAQAARARMIESRRNAYKTTQGGEA